MENLKINSDDLKQIINNLANTNGSTLRDYIELDPTSPVVKLRIKPNVEVMDMPEGYDVDKHINEVLLNLTLVSTSKSLEQAPEDDPENQILTPLDQLETTKSLTSIRVLAEGDSWFRLPELPGLFVLPRFFPKAIATQLQRRPGLQVKNIAYWGDTLRGMFQRKQYLTAIRDFQPEYFILSGGGNDLQANLRHYVHPYSANRPVHDYMTQAGYDLFFNIRETYVALIKEALAVKPDLKILVYGYDYPKPTKDSQYIGQHLHAKGIPESIMPEVIKPVIDRLNQRISEAANSSPQVTYIDCRNLAKNVMWFDDMHPYHQGYTFMANKFMEHIV